MSQTILIDDHELRRSMLALNLNVFVGSNIIIKDSAAEALALLKVHPMVDLIICQAQLKDQEAARTVLNYLLDEGRDIPLIILGQQEEERSKLDLYFLKSDCDCRQLTSLAAQILGVTAIELAEMPVPDLFPIPISCFLNLDHAPCDVYLRIRKGHQENHYLKRFKAGDPLGLETLTRYMAYGEGHLYIPALKRAEFAKIFTRRMLDKLNQKNLPFHERIQGTEESMKFISSHVGRLQLDQEILQLTESTLKSMERMVKDTPSLHFLLQNLLANRSGPLFLHCQLIIFVGRHLLRNMQWQTAQQMNKLAMVSFFHDLLLSQEKLALISSTEELEEALGKGALNADEGTLVHKHAYLCSESIKKISDLPSDVAQMVKQHHGQIGGIGFPSTYSPQLSPLVQIFIVSEHFVDVLLKNDGHDLSQILTILEKKQRGWTEKMLEMVPLLRNLPFKKT